MVYAASCHFSLHARNALIQESVRAFYTGWYNELATGLPQVKNGQVTVDFSCPAMAFRCCLIFGNGPMQSLV